MQFPYTYFHKRRLSVNRCAHISVQVGTAIENMESATVGQGGLARHAISLVLHLPMATTACNHVIVALTTPKVVTLR